MHAVKSIKKNYYHFYSLPVQLASIASARMKKAMNKRKSALTKPEMVSALTYLMISHDTSNDITCKGSKQL